MVNVDDLVNLSSKRKKFRESSQEYTSSTKERMASSDFARSIKEGECGNPRPTPTHTFFQFPISHYLFPFSITLIVEASVLFEN